MLSLVVCALRTNIHGVVKSSFKRPTYSLKYLYSTFTVKDFLYGTSHGESGTLNTRFVKYLALESCKFDPLIPQKIKYSDYYPVHDARSFSNLLRDTPTDQLPRLIVFTYTYKTNGDPYKFVQILNEIDTECMRRLNDMDCGGILRTLSSFMFLMPNKVTKLRFYEHSIKRLVHNFKDSDPKEKFVQVCFYLGMWKGNRQGAEMLENFLQSYLPVYLKDMNTVDFAIVSNSAYKTSVPIGDENFVNRLTEEILNSDARDDAMLVTLIKSLRLNRIKSNEICEKLKNVMGKDAHRFQFKGLVHIFAYFAGALWNDQEVCSKLIEECMKRLESVGLRNELFNDMRPKDIGTFIWCCAHLATEDLTATQLNFLEKVILAKINRNEYKQYPDQLIDCCLALWMLGHKSRDIISEIGSYNMNPNVKNSERVKLDSRVRLLMNCVQIEKPEWLSTKQIKEKAFIETRSAPDYLLKNRKSLNDVAEFLKEETQTFGLKSVKLVTPIAELNVAGILSEFEDGRKCFLEVLEHDQILKIVKKPTSIVGLKIRLLESLGNNVFVINPDDLESKDKLRTMLKEKFSAISSHDDDAREIAV